MSALLHKPTCACPLCVNLRQSRRPLAARLVDSSRLNPVTGCREWTGSIRGEAGYGVIYLAGRRVAAHRAAYELAFGPIPDAVQT